MVRTLKVIIMVVVFSFLWGLWWATKDKNPLLQPSPPEVVNVLAPENLISADLVQLLSKRGLQVNLVTRSDDYELLREILSPSMPYDVMLFPSTLTDSLQLSNYFTESFSEKAFDELKISIDFRSLNFDSENRFLVPLLWVVYGWALKEKDPDFSLKAVIQQKDSGKLAALPNAASLYGLLQKLSPEAHSFFQTSNEDELNSVLTRFQKHVVLRKTENPPWEQQGHTVQVHHTLSPELSLQGWHFALPMEKADLVLMLFGIHKNSVKTAAAKKLLSLLFENKLVKELVTTTSWATVKSHASTKDMLPEVFQSNYIRSLPISRLNILSYHEAFEPLFTEFLKKGYSEVLNESPKP